MSAHARTLMQPMFQSSGLVIASWMSSRSELNYTVTEQVTLHILTSVIPGIEVYACAKKWCQHQHGALEGAGRDQPRDADDGACMEHGAGSAASGAVEGQWVITGRAAAFNTIRG